MRIAVITTSLFLGAGAVASAQQSRGVPRLLLDRRLDERAVMLTALDNGTIRYTDGAGLPRTEPATEYLAILPQPAPPAAPHAPTATVAPEGAPDQQTVKAAAPEEQDRPLANPLVELTDGQRFAGSVAPEPPGEDSLRWATPALGPMEFKLDQVKRIRLHEGAWSAQPPEAATDDVLILSNGDHLHGFVESVAKNVRLTAGEGGKGQAREVPLERVYEVIFANPPVAASARAAVAWLRDGSVVSCRVIRSNREGELTLSAVLQESEAADVRAEGRPAAALRLEDLLAVAFESGGAAIKPLASVAPVQVSPGASRRWTRPVRAIDPERAVLGAADLDFPGPMSVSWDLPKGASRFAAQAELPVQSRTWGDCDLIVSAADAGGEKEVFRQHLSADAPAAVISVALPEGASRLTVRIDAGPLGPIQDRVVLHRPLLLIGK